MPSHHPTSHARRGREQAAWKSALQGERLLDLGTRIAGEAGRDWRLAPMAIARGLREARGLGSAERWLLGEAIHGWLRQRRRLEWLTGSRDPRVALRAWLEENRALLADGAGSKTGGVEAARSLAEIDDPVERMGTALSYPDWIVRRVLAQYGAVPGERLLAAMNGRAPLTVRANRIRCRREELCRRLAAAGVPATPTPLAEDGLVLETRRNVYDLVPWREGWMELQDEGSQLIAELVAPPPAGRIVDACAGAGGKSLALASLLGNRGRIAALDVVQAKLEELRRRARRAGATNLQTHLVARAGPIDLAPAERVLVDAPCSGTGVIRRNPETKWRLASEEIHELAAAQLALLERYAPLTRQGGRLIYATCSILAAENDDVIARFLERAPEFSLVPAKEILGKERALAMGDGAILRLLPHVHGTDGFFAAVLRRCV